MSYDLYTSLLKMHDTFRPSDEGVRLAIDMTAPENFHRFPDECAD